jgi:acyl-CoA thioesterase II
VLCGTRLRFMGDLAVDTAVYGESGRYEAELHEDWEIWGPNGGYLAAVALRAAGHHTQHPKPASFMCHFLEVATFDKVELEVETVRASRRTESMRVSMTQDGRRVLEGLVWAVDDGLEGLNHDAAPAPQVPGPEELLSTEERLAQSTQEDARYKFFSNFDERPVDWIDWEKRSAGEPVHRSWYRFRPVPCFDEAWVDAGRLLITVDTFQWPAAARGHAPGSLTYMAPSLDLACRFHRLEHARRAEWLLVEARSPVAAEGLVGGSAAVWDAGGTLLASGGQQMLCRPAPPR